MNYAGSKCFLLADFPSTSRPVPNALSDGVVTPKEYMLEQPQLQPFSPSSIKKHYSDIRRRRRSADLRLPVVICTGTAPTSGRGFDELPAKDDLRVRSGGREGQRARGEGNGGQKAGGGGNGVRRFGTIQVFSMEVK